MLNPCPVRSLRVVFHESRVFPSSHDGHRMATCKGSSLGAKLRRDFGHRRPDIDPCLAPCTGQLSSYCTVSKRLLKPCSPTSWAFFGSLELLAPWSPGLFTWRPLGQKSNGFHGSQKWRSRGSGSGSGTWLLGRRAVDCCPVPEAWNRGLTVDC